MKLQGKLGSASDGVEVKCKEWRRGRSRLFASVHESSLEEVQFTSCYYRKFPYQTEDKTAIAVNYVRPALIVYVFTFCAFRTVIISPWSRLPCFSSKDSRKTGIARMWSMGVGRPSCHPPNHRPTFKKMRYLSQFFMLILICLPY